MQLSIFDLALLGVIAQRAGPDGIARVDCATITDAVRSNRSTVSGGLQRLMARRLIRRRGGAGSTALSITAKGAALRRAAFTMMFPDLTTEPENAHAPDLRDPVGADAHKPSADAAPGPGADRTPADAPAVAADG